MSLVIGSRVGSYEVVALLGAGGMGEVYRARDTNLNRDVALKILPESFAADADRVARFKREAQVLASLNHANIAAIYGLEQNALVMELVDGDDLSAHIARGALPLSDALAIAHQLVDALEAAHEQGIVHRDLKPANIKLRGDGTVKVLDFGLAKALTPDSALGTQDSQNSPTLTARATQMGMIIGTAAYMSPEQARGKAVDRRADIWAFGVVLYEMLTGRRAFEGEDISITLASVLKEDVRFDALPADAPATIRRLLKRCLQKDPKRRLSAIGDARLELDEATAPGATDSSSAAPTLANDLAAARRRARWGWIAAGAMTLALVAGFVVVSQSRTGVAPSGRVQFAIQAEGPTFTVVQAYPALSPDGRLLAYVAPGPSGGPNMIWLRPMDGLESRSLPGTDGAMNLFWSTDSRIVGYTVAGGEMRRVDAAGGTPRKVCDIVNFVGATWMVSGDILFAANRPGASDRLFRVSGEGGNPVEVPQRSATGAAASIRYPWMLPDNQHFLYLGWSPNPGERALYVGSIDGAPPVKVTTAEYATQYASGFLLFIRDGGLLAQPFDAATFALSGEPVRVGEDLMANSVNGRVAFSVSSTGLLAYRTGAGAGGAVSDLAWIDRSGKVVGTVGDPRTYYQIRLSPDGRRVAFADSPYGSVEFKLSVMELSNGVSSGLTDPGVLANDPVWSPDSQTLAYEAVRGPRQLFTQRVGSADARLIFESPEDPKWLDDWSADGKFLLFHRPRPSKLYAVALDDPKTARLLLDIPGTIDGAHFSPDGKWIAYQTMESAVYQVWVAAFPAMDHRRRVSPQGGGIPFWRGDGKELFYLTPTGQLMSVGVDRTPSGDLEFAAPVQLFQSPQAAPQLTIDLYSAAKDGQRFLFITPRSSASARPPITVVVNWPSALKGS